MSGVMTVRSLKNVLCIVFMAMVLQSCGGGGSATTTPAAPPPPPPPPPVAFNAQLAMSMHNGGVDATDSTYIVDYDLAQSIGINAAQVLIPWNVFEPTAGVYDTSFFTNAGWGLDTLSARGLKILFTFPVIGVSEKKVPADLATLPLNDPVVISRYRNAIAQILPYLNSDVVYFSVGNEVDTRLMANPAEWAMYTELVDDAITYIHTLLPELKVGVTTTFENSVTEAANIAALNTNTDIHIMTYYLVDDTFLVRGPPDTVLTDLDTMLSQAAGKPLVLQEVGYPSSGVNGGTEAEQAEFVEHVFAKWQLVGSTQIPYIAFFKQKNWNATFCETITGQVATQTFYEFMCSLGFTNNDNSMKPAWTALANEIQTANLQ